MKIHSTRFGEIEVPEENVIRFADGLLGFEQEKTFAIMAQPDSPFVYLQSADDADLTFLTVEPFGFFPQYEFELPEPVMEELNLTAADAPYVLCIVRIQREAADATANLLAPLIVNAKDNIAKQVILENTRYTTRRRLFSETTVKAFRGKGGC